MLEARVFDSIEQIGREAWDAACPDALDGFAYLAAIDAAALPGLSRRYILVEDARRPAAAAPTFVADYRLDAALDDRCRRMVAVPPRFAPRGADVRIAWLGSPCTDDLALGFAADLDPALRPDVLRLMLDALEEVAAREGCGLIAVKDAPAAQDGLWSATACEAGYETAPGMPATVLPIDFPDLDGYLARLSPATRKDMRRKLKAMGALRIEVVGDISGLEERILELYHQTRARLDLQLENLTAGFFTGVLNRLGERGLCVLYWAGETLIGFNLLLRDETTLVDKLLCTETARGRAFNLYFVSWFVNVRLCLERGLTQYRSGQAGYVDKLRLGSRLCGATTYFRDRRPAVRRALPWRARPMADPLVLIRGAA